MRSVEKSYGSIDTNSTPFNSTIERSASERSRQESMCYKLVTYFSEVRYIPGFRQFPGVKICLLIAFLHRMHLYSVFIFLANLQVVRNDTAECNIDNLNNASYTYSHMNNTPCKKFIPPKNRFAEENTAVIASIFMALVYLLAPIPGFLADRYFSRHKTVLASLFLCILGSLSLSAFHTYYELIRMQNELIDSIYDVIHFGSLLILACGSTGIIALLVPLGVDQMEGAGESTIKSYFNWHYWAGNLGGLLAPGGYFIYKASVTSKYILLAGSYAAIITIALALILCFISLYCNILQMHKPVGSPILKIAKVLSSATKGYKQERDEYDRKSLLDYAVGDVRGKHSFESVDDVKTFFRMTMVFATMVWYFATYDLLTSVFPLQGQALSCSENSFFASCFIVLVDGTAVMITIPIIEFVRRKYYSIRVSKILYKFLIGVLLSLAAVYYAWISDMTQYFTQFSKCPQPQPRSILSMFKLDLILLPQIILIGVSESFSMVAAIEFVYAQSPHDMKGFLFGLMNFFVGIGFYIPTTLHSVVKELTCDQDYSDCSFCMAYEQKCFLHYQTPRFMYYFIFAIITTLYALLMYVVAVKYKRRQREPISNWLVY
ncbi:Solute carrier family 15 member 4-like [Oopsacas minuta]|uniref:Solute carrier family 15 member 4-like n=1 Tax=Oopsacas minuta TaxID=111878 RepID=A0AAV7JCM6_9METZ|nr:Solute carrier family 15 member 4-like [Oopsacas minuta]